MNYGFRATQHDCPTGVKSTTDYGYPIIPNKDGKPTGQWVKSKLDDARRLEAVRAAIEAMAAEVPSIAATPAPIVSNDDLLTLYTEQTNVD